MVMFKCVKFIIKFFSTLFLMHTIGKFVYFISTDWEWRQTSHHSKVPLGFYQYKASQEDGIPVKIFIDLGLLLLFVGQHRLMSSTLSVYGELQDKFILRHVYLTASCLTLQTLMYFWQPINSIALWSFEVQDNPSLLSLLCFIIHIFAWMILFFEHIIVVCVFSRGPKEVIASALFGSSSSYSSNKLRDLFYHMPHPGAVCFTVALWVFPVMTLDRWILATVLTWYIFVPNRVTRKDFRYMQKQFIRESSVREDTYSVRFKHIERR